VSDKRKLKCKKRQKLSWTRRIRRWKHCRDSCSN